ncbi:MAG: hypothetical protein ABEK02_00190 [Haloquadratum sp.]
MTEEATATRETAQHSSLDPLRRVAFVVLLLPVVTLAPLLYRQRPDDGDDERAWFERSPLKTVPGLDADSWAPALGYAVVLVALSLGVSYVVPGLWFPTDGFLLAGGLVVGAGTLAYLYRSSGLDRELAKRTGYGALVGVVYTVVIASVFQTVVFGSGVMLLASPGFLSAAGFPFLIGVMAGNAYAVKREQFKQESKREGEGESETNVRTDPSRGTDLSDSKGQSIIEAFAEQSWVAPDDLATDSDIRGTRRIEPLRDIVRGLWVESTRYEKTVPKPDFQDEKRSHRSDYDDRHDVAPSGFESATYTFFVPGSRAEKSCGNCHGNGSLTCSTCNGDGRVTCGACNGSGKTNCANCGGEGRITQTRKCSVCGGSGESKEGVWCSNCGGDGYIEETKNCPECRFGEVDCSSCGGSGKQTCSSCDGTGRHTCGECKGSGRLVQYEYVERTYEPNEDVSYRNKSVPERLLTGADGTRVDIETDHSPSRDGLYRRQDETRKIPVTVLTYDYLGDTWELFEIEDSIEAIDFPRDYRKQFRVVQAGVVLLVPTYLVVVVATSL